MSDSRGSFDRDCTLDALDDVTGKLMTFNDYVNEGGEVSLYRDPSQERGFLGLRLLYRDDAGTWRLRELTADENTARTARILGEAR
jgi:hypothetical protein